MQERGLEQTVKEGSILSPPAEIWGIPKPDLSSLHPFCPEEKDVYRALEIVRPEDVKVILLGQDPYPQQGVGTGLAFANKTGTRVLSPSLDIIRQELLRSNLGDITSCCDLEHLPGQGVLLLNSALTVKENEPGSHQKFWKDFLRQVLKACDKQGTVFAMLGKTASSFSGCVKLGYCLKVSHPQADNYGNRFSFRGSNLFEDINLLLQHSKQTPINWA